MTKVIITGISGFVGTQLAQVLSKNFTVQGMSLRDGVENKEVPEDCEAIVHLAGKAHDLANTSDAAEYFVVNTDYTLQLFEKFLASKATTFIFISSVKAVADTVTGVLTEDYKAKPITPYGLSKLKAEQALLSKVVPTHKRLFILRPCMIHGSNNKGNLNLLYALVEKGIPYPLGAFNNKRSFLHIDNLCLIIEKLIVEKPTSDVFNVADDDAISTKELVLLMYQSLGKKPRILSLPKTLISIIGSVGTFFSLPFSKEKLSKLTENYVVSNHKVKKTLQIDQSFSTKQGLLKTLDSFKNI